MTLRDQIVTEIMSLVRQPPRKLEKPTIDELERIINSESTDAVNIEPDGSVSVTPTVTTIGAVADKVAALCEAETEKWRSILLSFVASLTLCDHMGDVGNDVTDVLKLLDMDDIEWEDWSDLSDEFGRRGIKTLNGTSFSSDEE